MRCPKCKKDGMICEQQDHAYRESGLDGVVLKGVEVCKCGCGEEIVVIPSIIEVHDRIACHILTKKNLLNGREIRFLRKNMGLTAKRLGECMGIDNATISRWENGVQPITKPHDLLLRLIYSNIRVTDHELTKRLVTDDFPLIRQDKTEAPSIAISL